jgi:hypothetical protein
MVDQATAQSDQRAIRAYPPTFDRQTYADLFFSDLGAALTGELPQADSAQFERRPGLSPDESLSLPGLPGSEGTSASPEAGEPPRPQKNSSAQEWRVLISAGNIEDLVKESKQRLEQIVTTPSAFASGGFQKARTEFALLALLFAIIEEYSEEVRWKSSASTMKWLMNRVANNSKVGSRLVFDEARQRKDDLHSLLSGTQTAAVPQTEVAWEHLIDMGPLMQLMERAYDQKISQFVADEERLEMHVDELLRSADLISILAKTSTLEGMSYADDDQFREYAEELIRSARAMAEAVAKKDPSGARLASGRMGQCCQKCHASFR